MLRSAQIIPFPCASDRRSMPSAVVAAKTEFLSDIERRCSGRIRTFWTDPHELPFADRLLSPFWFAPVDSWTSEDLRTVGALLADRLPRAAREAGYEMQLHAISGYNFSVPRRLARFAYWLSVCVVADRWRVKASVGLDANLLPRTLAVLASLPFTEDSHLQPASPGIGEKS